jgi:hypothetical protein
VDDASHDAKMVDVLDKDFGGKVVHFSKILQATTLHAEGGMKWRIAAKPSLAESLACRCEGGARQILQTVIRSNVLE